MSPLADPHRALTWSSLVFLVVGASAYVLLLATDHTLADGTHRAMKPMKFGLSIALFLATMAFLIPELSIDARLRGGLARILIVTMAVEMVVIVGQALRGTKSHFNVEGAQNSALWIVMVVAIVVATGAMLVVTVIAWARPLTHADALPSTLLAWGWRVGLVVFMLSAVSGFAMGGRLQHGVGGVDGGAGLPLLGWSTRHGDLRVSHFFSMHALQALPLAGIVAPRLGPRAGGALFVVVVVAVAFVAAGTLLQAFAGRPLLDSTFR